MKKELVEVVEKNEVYELRIENWWHGEDQGKTRMVAAYSSIDGSYIGNLDEVVALVGKFGIAPQAIDGSKGVASVGYSEREGKWYGWSHRALCGFQIGHVTKEGECQTTSGYTDEYIKEHPEELETLIEPGFECKTLEDCKKVAIAFARSVS